MKALARYSEGVSQFCSLNRTYKSRTQAVLILGSSCAAENAATFISAVRGFALSEFLMTGTKISTFLM